MVWTVFLILDTDTFHPAFGEKDIEYIMGLWDNDPGFENLIYYIAEYGYIDFSPMIIIRGHGRYIVQDGNKRLAAIMLLKYPQFGERCGIKSPLTRPEISDTLMKIAVYQVERFPEVEMCKVAGFHTPIGVFASAYSIMVKRWAR